MTLRRPRARALTALRASSRALAALSHVAPAALRAAKLLAARRGKVITSGVGKSGFIAMKAAATLTSLGHPAVYLDPLAALHGDSGHAKRGDALIAFSFSGESIELVKLAQHLKKLGVTVIALSHGRRSALARLADLVVDVPVAEEGSPHNLAPMASTTASLALSDMIAAALTDPTIFSHQSFARFHPAGALGLSLTFVRDIMRARGQTPALRLDRSFEEALKVMTRGGLGVVAVVDRGGRLVGTVTDGDVRRILMRLDSPKGLPVRMLMTKHPKSISENASLKEALALMELHKITSLFVVGEGKMLRSIIHLHDLVSA